ncbi:MAG: hypothetical protein HY435_00725 [Candidatus Liptonbacteria bacterium]|nr:hypothetical protein [Candidatus Liptonbacteria bacterium]
MNPKEFKTLIQIIVAEAAKLRDARTTEHQAPVNYACVFSQSDEEYELLLTVAKQLGKAVQETAMGPVFYIEPLDTVAGDLRLVKIRKPDPKRTERGDADFTVTDYLTFKKTYFGKPGFRIIERPNMEMIELADPGFNVLAYFSNPPLGKVLNLDF